MRFPLCVRYFLALLATALAFVGNLACQESFLKFDRFQQKLLDTSNEAATCSIAGLIVHIETNQPIRKATIELSSADEHKKRYLALSDASGRFLIRGIEPGSYHLRVRRIGYLTQSFGQDSAGERDSVFVIAAGRSVEDLVFRMTPWGVISGRVTDEYGEPIPGAQVEALRSQIHNGERRLFNDNSVRTNDIGEYRIYGLDVGRYYVKVEYSESLVGEYLLTASQFAYAPVFYPDTIDIRHAVAVEVRPGQQVSSINFSLTPAPSVRLRGSVYNAVQNRPAKGCCVFLEPRDSSEEFQGPRGPGYGLASNGSFNIDGVVPGSYVLVASAFIEGKIHYARLSVDVGSGDLNDVRLVIMPSVTLRGRILDDGPEPLAFSNLYIYLQSVETGVSYASPTKAKPDGSFDLLDIPVGTYEIGIVGAPKQTYLKSLTMNGVDVLPDKLDIGSGGSRGSLDLTLSSAGHQVDGSVTDDNDNLIPGASVVLVPSGTRRKQYRLYKNTRTDRNGRFRLEGISPGDYKLFSWRNVEVDEWQDPEFLKVFEDKGIEIDAEENGHSSVQLKTISSDPLKP